VRDGWGRLVPPGDPAALAAGLGELLVLPRKEREQMGRAGREWVLEGFSTDGQAARLAALFDAPHRVDGSGDGFGS
ncbi:MAG: hypothetical protein H0V29_12785, partial [Thermoleophilaceae bacterium]|nr:hypothetical protein [Thermoleophilaceae bacterium]